MNKGNWAKVDANLVHNKNGIYAAAYRCSECGDCSPFKSKYCPSCGANMKTERSNAELIADLRKYGDYCDRWGDTDHSDMMKQAANVIEKLMKQET